MMIRAKVDSRRVPNSGTLVLLWLAVASAVAACGGGHGGGGGGDPPASTRATYSVGGSIAVEGGSGVLPQGLALTDGTDTNYPVPAGTSSFSFPTGLPSGTKYAIAVTNAPPSTSCSVANGNGTVSTGDVTNVGVSCTYGSYALGGTIQGLNASGLILAEGNQDLPVAAGQTSFRFPQAIVYGSTYDVVIAHQPSGGTLCSTGNYSGTMPASSVNDVSVVCSTATFTLGGAISGLNSGGLVLANAGQNLAVPSGTASFRFAQALPSGAAYDVTIASQPASGTTCAVSNGQGTVASTNITSVVVTCVTVSGYTVGGNLTGLEAGGTITLQNNGGDNLPLSANGGFRFATAIADSSAYSVSISTLPSGQPCSSLYTSGNYTGANVGNVQVFCGPPVLGRWTAGPNLLQGAQSGAQTSLADGRVLLVAGTNGAANSNTAQIYDPGSNAWSPAGSIAKPVTRLTATLLATGSASAGYPAGQVLVAGGNTGSGAVATAQLYNPATGAWTMTSAMAVPRFGHFAVLLQNGKVLVGGGGTSFPACGVTSSAELYDPASGSWSTVASMSVPRMGATATLLPNGKVLVAGGQGVCPSLYSDSSAEIYDPATDQWSTDTPAMPNARVGHVATLLPNGRVLVMGGESVSLLVNVMIPGAALYDPAGNSWSSGGTLVTPRTLPSASLLPTGKVILMGGSTSLLCCLATAATEIYDPASNAWSAAAPMNDARYDFSATLLDSGRLLVSGGLASYTTSELYW